MLKYITSFFKFLAPIVRKAIIQVAADELSKVAYDRPVRRYGRNTPYADYQRRVPSQRRPRTMEDIDRLEHERLTRMGVRSFDVETKGLTHAGKPFHDVLMIAFDVSGPNAYETHMWLMENMPASGTGGDHDEIYLDSWWVANDERFDGDSDTESAVFVKKGSQEEARALLREHGLGN